MTRLGGEGRLAPVSRSNSPSKNTLSFYIGMSLTRRCPVNRQSVTKASNGFGYLLCPISPLSASSNRKPSSIIKSQAKQHAGEHDTKLSAAQEALARQAGFSTMELVLDVNLFDDINSEM